jgi:hypothetical protein
VLDKILELANSLFSTEGAKSSTSKANRAKQDIPAGITVETAARKKGWKGEGAKLSSLF